MTPTEQSYREIALTQGRVAIVDAADYEWISQWKWYAHWNPGTQSFYARRQEARESGKQITVLMHREILGVKKGVRVHIDHKDGNTLDNRRDNIRVANFSENFRNRRRSSANTSGHTGVSTTNNGGWLAKVTVEGRSFYKTFRVKDDAVQWRLAMVAEHHGEFSFARSRGKP